MKITKCYKKILDQLEQQEDIKDLRRLGLTEEEIEGYLAFDFENREEILNSKKDQKCATQFVN